MQRYVYLVVVSLALVIGKSEAQNVGALLTSNWQLPQTAEDGRVLSRVFDAIDAVQTVCPQSLVDSLSEQGALAACAIPTRGDRLDSLLGSHGRNMIESRVRSPFGSWRTPWQEDPGFGAVRQLSYQGNVYFIALNSSTGLAYVVRFEN